MDAKRRPSSIESTASGKTELIKNHMFSSVNIVLTVAACLLCHGMNAIYIVVHFLFKNHMSSSVNIVLTVAACLLCHGMNAIYIVVHFLFVFFVLFDVSWLNVLPCTYFTYSTSSIVESIILVHGKCTAALVQNYRSTCSAL